MRVLITGATGFLGRALCLRLLRDGHQLKAWSRSPRAVAGALGPEVEACGGDDDALEAALEDVDAVIHLAGEPVLPGRWTGPRKAALVQSRVGLTWRLVRALRALPRRPRALLSASAVGLYGDGGDAVLTEQSPPGQGFLADLCREWEAAARGAEDLGMRVVRLRIGIVLGRDGGALGPLAPLFRFGLGGPQGSGRQFVPWIHLDDAVEAMVRALQDEAVSGPLLLCGPDPVPQAELARALGRALRRPALLPAPAFALRLALGEAATALLEGQRAVPEGLRQLGFRFRFPTLDAALTDLLRDDGAAELRPLRALLDVDEGLPYLRARRPTWELRAAVDVPAPPAAAWGLLSDPAWLGPLTPPSMRMDLDPQARFEVGAPFTHRLRLGPLRLPWTGRFVGIDPGRSFVDVQESGPWGCFWHRHGVEALPGGGARFTDRVLLRPPAGPIGELAMHLDLKARMMSLFAYRTAALRLRFGAPGAA